MIFEAAVRKGIITETVKNTSRMFSWKCEWEGLTQPWNNPEEELVLESPLRDFMMTTETLFISCIPETNVPKTGTV